MASSCRFFMFSWEVSGSSQVRRRRYFEDTQDIKKRKASTRFKKVYKCVPSQRLDVTCHVQSASPDEAPTSTGRRQRLTLTRA